MVPTLKTEHLGFHSHPEFALARLRFTTAVARIGRTFVVLAAVCLLTGPLHSQSAGMPAIPPLPPNGWPLPATAEPFARELISRVPPSQLDTIVTANADALPAGFRKPGTALMSRDTGLQNAVKRYTPQLVHVHATRIRP